MSSSSLSSLHPAALPPGTPVGPFRVLEWAGRGVNGAVYRAERIGREHLPPVALKLAVLPEDPRYLREQELLSRSLHPHIPRLVGAGLWASPEGARHPFVAMQWIDGVPLYDWGRMFRPSAQQQLRLLAQAALTLQYLHAQDALHRDFNVRQHCGDELREVPEVRRRAVVRRGVSAGEDVPSLPRLRASSERGCPRSRAGQ